ncbi:MAG: hypothetical protein AAB392_03185 [Patescibacteria group bacterium]
MNYLDGVYNFLFNLKIEAGDVASFVFWAIFLFVLVVFCVVLYHWRKYGLGGPILVIAELVYIGVSALLLIFAYFSLN